MAERGALYEEGDVLPALRVVRAGDVHVGDVYWGCQQINPRKGWLLEPERVPVDTPPRPAGDGSTVHVLVAGRPVPPDRLVLVERSRHRDPLCGQCGARLPRHYPGCRRPVEAVHAADAAIEPPTPEETTMAEAATNPMTRIRRALGRMPYGGSAELMRMPNATIEDVANYLDALVPVLTDAVKEHERTAAELLKLRRLIRAGGQLATLLLRSDDIGPID